MLALSGAVAAVTGLLACNSTGNSSGTKEDSHGHGQDDVNTGAGQKE